jgi:hypothetical protein
VLRRHKSTADITARATPETSSATGSAKKTYGDTMSQINSGAPERKYSQKPSSFVTVDPSC